MKIVWTLFLLLLVPSVYAESLQCDRATVNIEYSNKSPLGWELVTLRIVNGKEEITKKFEYIHFFITCLNNPAKKPYIIYQAYCSGSGCKDFDNWGIIDPSLMKVLLEPSDNNHKKAERIFGGKLKPF
ncbi:MAG TPA: hypothetical protein VEP71_01230 [Gallionella sp.]|nr:hypothetical protein [Gallionella sp.]